jgi:hypothetical protein
LSFNPPPKEEPMSYVIVGVSCFALLYALYCYCNENVDEKSHILLVAVVSASTFTLFCFFVDHVLPPSNKAVIMFAESPKPAKLVRKAEPMAENRRNR